MKLATSRDGTRDGRLVVVSRDLARQEPAVAAHTMLDAIERWAEVSPALQAQYGALNQGGGQPFDAADAMAPLPRTWQWLDGSAFHCHGELLSAAFGKDPMKIEAPLMYQGVSAPFLGPADDVAFPSEAGGIDFEGEFGVVIDGVPMGVDASRARDHIKLIVQLNDWTLRNLQPREAATGFGWVHSKPLCSFAPVAVTPDELGEAWKDARVHLDLNIEWNGKQFGAANGGPMDYGFDDLIAHGAATRPLVAGTVIGSGTVSNRAYRDVGSSCIMERRGIEMIDHGAPRTEFMKFGDVVVMEAKAADGSSVFGAIHQRVVQL